MAVDFNRDPYWDDFNEKKNYLRILFRPGVAVQARELTQLQTALQNQIGRFGQSVYKDGSIVLNGQTHVTELNWVDVDDVSPSITLKDRKFTGQTSGARGKIYSVNRIDDSRTRIYFQYLSGVNIERAEQLFIDDEEITLFLSVLDEDGITGVATGFSIEDSVFYVKTEREVDNPDFVFDSEIINESQESSSIDVRSFKGGYFIYCDEQRIILSEDSPNDDVDEPLESYKVGLSVSEDIITPRDDSTLNDPARGFNNYAAPGADRYTIDLTLSKVSYNPQDETDQNFPGTGNFIELARFANEELVEKVDRVRYSDLETTFARRTYDESGDYTVKPFRIKVKEHVGNDPEKLTVTVKPGKAYVKGYEFETTSPVNLNLDRSRDTDSRENITTVGDFGEYFVVTNPTGDTFSYNTHELIDLVNDSDGTIGTARVRGAVPEGGSSIRVAVFDISIDEGYSAIDIDSLSSGSWTGDLVTSRVYRNERKSFIRPLPNRNLNTIDVGSYQSFRAFGVTSPLQIDSNDEITFSEAGVSIIGTDPDDYYVIDSDTGERIPVLNVSGNVDQRTLELSVTTQSSASVYTYVSVNSPDQINKQLETETITVSATSDSISLNRSDCYELLSVTAKDTATTNPLADRQITRFFSFDTGQRDTYYDHGSIRLNDGVTIESEYDQFEITFSYFSHTGEGTFFSVDSYTDSGIDYEDIPTFTSSSGTVYSLSDCLDFRPIRQPNSSEFGNTTPAFIDSLIVSDYSFYLSRIDKLVVTKERKFKIIEGTPSVEPTIPKNNFDAMPIYTLRIPAYTARAEDVSFSYIDNRRFTMRDIGKLQRRIDRLEEFSTLSNIEKLVNDTTFTDSIGNDLFKNAILVDNFKGHSVGDVFSDEYQASIDREKQLLRPRHSPKSFGYVVEGGSSGLSNLVKNDDIITLSYTTRLFNEQPYATNSINVNPYLTFGWKGNLNLRPDNDTWVDTSVKPDVIVNLNGENDVFTNLVENVDNPAAVGVRWNDWQTVHRGVEVDDNLVTNSTVSTETEGDRVLEITNSTTVNEQTVTTEETLSRVGLEISQSSPIANYTDLGNKITDVSIAPYVRSRVVYFSATNMKPNTELVASFDGVEVTDYIQPAVELIVDSTVPSDAGYVSSGGKRARIVLRKTDRMFVIYDAGSSAFGISDTVSYENRDEENIDGTSTVTDVNSYSDHTLISNEDGDVAGSFTIPNNDDLRFNTGEIAFRIADSLDRFATTAAETKYVAQGLAQETERTLVSTRVANVSIDPLMDIDVQENTETRNIAVSQETSTEDVTPPPPPPASPVRISCPQNVSANGRRGTFTYIIDFDTLLGTTGIVYTPTSIPVRYTIVYDGQEYTTGFVGSEEYNDRLNSLGYPNVSGSGSGQLTFEKTRETPREGILTVEAPIFNSEWNFTAECPTDQPLPPEPEPTPYSVEVDISAVSRHTMQTDDQFETVPLDITARRSDEGTDSWLLVDLSLSNVTSSSLSSSRLNVLNTSTQPSLSDSQVIIRCGSTQRVNLSVPATWPRTDYSLTVTASAEEYEDESATVPSDTQEDRDTESATDTDTHSLTVRERTVWGYYDPVAQSFFIDSTRYPNGVFVNSLDLFFRTKSTDNTPVTVHIRPTVNGYPSSSKILPFSVASLESSEINVSDDGTVPTTFNFDAPIHLAPGEYAFVVVSSSDEYNLFTSRLGEFSLENENDRVTTQPTLGTLFKSQNASTWTADQEQDVKYRIYQCSFDTSGEGIVTFNTDISSENGDVLYDLFYTDGEHVDFAATDIRHEYQINSNGWKKYQLGSNNELSETQTLSASDPTSLQFKSILSTNDANVSPVVDVSRLSSVLVRNVINNNDNSEESEYSAFVDSLYATSSQIFVNTTDTNILEEGDRVSIRFETNVEFNGAYIVQDIISGTRFSITRRVGTDPIGDQSSPVVQGGTVTRGPQALAKYITRRVNLSEGFEARDLRIQFSSKQPAGTRVVPYYKVSSVYDTDFESNDWVEMQLENETSIIAENDFDQLQYGPPFETGGVFGNDERYDTFSIKLVLLSDDTSSVPYVKDLRVVALD